MSGVIATVATAVGVLTTFGIVGDGGGAPPPAVAVASAAAKAGDASSSRVLVTVIDTRAGAPAGSGTKTLGAGEYDYRRGRGRMEYDLSQQKGLEDLYAVEVRFDGQTFFVRDPGTFGLAKNKPWLRATLAELARSDPAFAAIADIGVHDPMHALEELQANASDTKRIGEEQLHGFKTTHYRGHRDPDGGGPARPVTEDVWVDENGYLRQLETVRQTASGTETTRTELDDFGVHVDTALPPRGRVLDYGTLK